MEGMQNMAVGALEAFLPIYAVTVAGLNEFQAGHPLGCPGRHDHLVKAGHGQDIGQVRKDSA